MDEIAMQLRHDFRMLEHDLGHEGAGLQVAAPLELEHVALGADDRARGRVAAAGRVALRSRMRVMACGLAQEWAPQNYLTFDRDRPDAPLARHATWPDPAARLEHSSRDADGDPAPDAISAAAEHLPASRTDCDGNADVHPAQPARDRRAHARAPLDRQRRRRRRDPDRRAARDRDHAEPARRRHGALPGLDRDDDSVDRAVRRADPDPVEDRPGHRLAARRHRRDALRAAADHPQHVHGDPQRRPGAALGGDRDGHVGRRSGSRASRSRSRCRSSSPASGSRSSSTSASPRSPRTSAPAASARSSRAAFRRRTSGSSSPAR